MGVNQFQEIKDGDYVSRVYRLPLAHLPVGNENDPSAREPEWYDLPEGFLSGVTLASKYVGSRPSFPEQQFITRVHIEGGKAYATDNKLAVEIDMGGDCPLALTLSVKQVRAINAFGTAPSHAGVCERQNFRWPDGRRLALPKLSDGGGRVRAMFDRFDWNDFHAVDPSWRAQIVGHFAFKPMRENDGLLTVLPDRIIGGIFDSRADTELSIETHTDREEQFEMGVFLNAVKLATEIKFVLDGDHARLLFRGANVRGIAAPRYRVAP